MSTEKIVALVVTLVIVAGIWWAIRHERKSNRPMTKEEYDQHHRRNPNEREP